MNDASLDNFRIRRCPTVGFLRCSGTVAGGVISATVAAGLTVAFGEAYIATLQALLKDNPDRQLSGQEVADAFKRRLDA